MIHYKKIYYWRNIPVGISASDSATELIKKQNNSHGQLIWADSLFKPLSYIVFL